METDFSDEDLRNAIRLKNRERKAMLDFFELGRLKPSPVSGYEINTVIDANGFIFDTEEKIAILENPPQNYSGICKQLPGQAIAAPF